MPLIILMLKNGNKILLLFSLTNFMQKTTARIRSAVVLYCLNFLNKQIGELSITNKTDRLK